MRMDEVVLEVKNLELTLKKRKIINDISFKVFKGSVFGFLGPNGSGKTTTIKLILGLLKPNKGEVFINNTSLRKDYYGALSQIGALIEGPAFYEYLSAEENLNIFGKYSGGVSKEKIKELIEIVGLSGREKEKVSDYSLGMKQRLGIAQALINDPQIIILDEPINGLDPKGIQDIRNIINYLTKEKQITVFISSHILSEIELICDKVFIIYNGSEIAQGAINNLIKEEIKYEIHSQNVDSLYSELKNMDEITIDKYDLNSVTIKTNKNLKIEDLIKYLVNKNIGITAFIPIKPSLEDSFFKLIDDYDKENNK